MTLSEEARKYIGQKEISGNMGFVNPAFEKEMVEEGFRKTWAWCAIFVRLVALNTYPDQSPKLRRYFSPSVMTTFRNFRNAGYAISFTPAVNYLVFYQMFKNGKGQGTGHIGIVSKINGMTYNDISGNTNEAGSREGNIVAEKEHKLNLTTANGLRCIGFIKLP
jgi:hypothetical protein